MEGLRLNEDEGKQEKLEKIKKGLDSLFETAGFNLDSIEELSPYYASQALIIYDQLKGKSAEEIKIKKKEIMVCQQLGALQVKSHIYDLLDTLKLKHQITLK